MASEDTMFQEAVTAIEKGDKSRALDLLTRLIKINAGRAEYWLYMSAVVSTNREKIYCLKETLRLDPNNRIARQGLILSGELPVDPSLVVPYKAQKRHWLVEPIPGSIPPPAARAPIWGYILLFIVSAFALLSLVLLGLFGTILFKPQIPATNQPLATSLPTATALPTQSLPSLTPVGTSQSGSTLPWLLLEATYTPTPVYINTPHPRTEEFRSAQRSIQRSDWASAVTFLLTAISKEPDAPDLQYYLGEAYRLQKNYTQAQTAYNKAIQISTRFAPAYLGRARARLGADSEKWKDAQSDLEKALEYDPRLYEAYLELASISLDRKDAKAALGFLDSASNLIPNSALIILYRARAYLLMDKPDLALSNAQDANRRDLTLMETYRTLGQAWLANNNPKEALKVLQIYTQFVTDDTLAWAWLGMAYSGNQQFEPAQEAFEKALKLNNRLFEAYLGRGQLNLARKDGKAALNDLDTAEKLNPESFEASLGKGQSYQLNGYAGDAYIQYNKSEALAKTASQRAQLYYWRAQSLEALNELRAAAKDWQALLEIPRDFVPVEWVDFARLRLQVLISPTPTSARSLTPTATPTRTVTLTATPTRTVTPTATPNRTTTP